MPVKTTVIIPTYNRPRELAACLRSLLAQQVKPDEIIVVDDGALSGFPLQREAEALGIRCVYHRKQTPGLTASRNAGVALARGGIIFFLDDDVELLPDYLAEILRVFADYRGRDLGGVGGLIANPKPLTRARRLRAFYDRLFLIAGSREGKILPSGFCTDYGKTPFPLQGLTEVDFLAGGVSAYKREVFAEFAFSEAYRGYGLGEDKDFSCRVGRKYKLLVNPAARLYHYESARMRYDMVEHGRQAVLSRYYFFKTYCRKGWWSWLFFAYALVGYLLIRLLITIVARDRRELQRVRGMWGAVRDLVGGRVSGR